MNIKKLQSRITADLDTKNKNKILFSVAEALYKIPKITSLEIKPSNSKGYHLIIWTQKKYSQKQIYKIRAKIGDDKNRIKLDKLRKIGLNTLFDRKENLKGNKK